MLKRFSLYKELSWKISDLPQLHKGYLQNIHTKYLSININATSPADALIQSYNYTYDDAGNIRKKDTEHGAYAYSYDKLDRLIRSDNPVLTDESFTYDQVWGTGYPQRMCPAAGAK